MPVPMCLLIFTCDSFQVVLVHSGGSRFYIVVSDLLFYTTERQDKNARVKERSVNSLFEQA